MGVGLSVFPGGISNAALFVPKQTMERDEAIFASFWMGGFDGADHVGGADSAASMGDVTQHHMLAAADYARLAEFGIRTVRESVGWRAVDRPGGFDYSCVETRARAARAEGLQVVWTLCHYGWPDDLDVFSSDFVDRFARYAGAVARHLADYSSASPVFAPIDELSFLSWAACEAGRVQFDSRLQNCTRELKRQLVRAAIAACNAIWEVDPRARILHTDPLVHIVAPVRRNDLAQEAARQCEHQFQGWDMLCGKIEPELGGHPRYLDLVGVNYYLGNQWELLTGRTLNWRLDDPRRVSLAALLDKVHRRYGRPLVIAETGHVGIGRASWLRDVAADVNAARRQGVPVQGLCLHPVIDRPDWDNTDKWHSSGLWDLEPSGDGELRRHLDEDYAAALHEVQRDRPEPLPRHLHQLQVQSAHESHV